MSSYINVKLSNQGIDEAGDFILTSSLPESCSKIIDEVPFLFPSKANDKYDNIAFEGQRIFVSGNNYSSMYILGCSEVADVKDIITLLYEDGDVEESEICFYNCYGIDKNRTFYYDKIENCGLALEVKVFKKQILELIYSVTI